MTHALRALAGAALLAFPVVGAAQAQGRTPLDMAPYPHISASSVAFDWRNPQRERFGRLTYRGGLAFGFDQFRRFGGLSGIVLTEDGKRFAAVSDAGDFFSGTIDYRDGRLASIGPVDLMRLRDATGTPLRKRRDRDAEGLAATDGLYLGKALLVSFEHNHRLMSLRIDARGKALRPRDIALPHGISGLPDNQGLEAIGLFPKDTPLAGTTIALAERLLDNERNHTGWLIAQGKARRIAIARSQSFEITDLAILPDGDVILLERRFALIFGFSVRLRLIEAEDLTKDGLIEGEILLSADNRYTVDNFEGLAIHRDHDGGIVLTLVSDNNFNTAQRTLLMQFRLD